MIVAPGSTSVSVDVQFLDDTGAAVTGKVAADFPACKWSAGNNTADTTITLSDLAAITTAHPNDNTAGGVKEREGGWYRLDLPNNMITNTGAKRLTFAETTNKRINAPLIEVQYVPADLGRILGSGFTEDSPGYIAAAFKKLLNVASPLFHVGAVDEPTGVPVWGTSGLLKIVAWMAAFTINRVNESSTTQTLRNNADAANLGSAPVADSGGTFSRGKFT